MAEKVGHHFYEDVVAVWKEDEERSRELLHGLKAVKYQKLKIWLRGSENIAWSVATKLFVPRRTFIDSVRHGLRQYDPLETEIDVVVNNLSAMLDNQKQLGSQSHTMSHDTPKLYG
jgi:hypothetical protein